MGWANSHIGHKTTLKCPQKGCRYTSRRFVSLSDPKNQLSNSSITCPIHQVKLINIGGSESAVKNTK